MEFRQIVKKYDDAITFGKYFGKSFRYILEENPSYIVWLNDENIVKLPARLVEKAEKMKFDRTSISSSQVYHSDDDPIYGGCDPNMWGDIGI